MLKGDWKPNLSLHEVVALGCKALVGAGDGTEIGDLDEAALEIAILDRSREDRKFKRLGKPEIKGLLGR